MTNFFTKYLFISVALFFGLSEIANAQLGSFAERKKFNIESDSISGASDLINFPVLVNVTLPSGDVENANGFDIAFTAGDGTTQLDHDLESYDSGTGELVAWVRFSSLSATTDTQFFYLLR